MSGPSSPATTRSPPTSWSILSIRTANSNPCRPLREIAARGFGIQHITLQVERSPEGCTEHHHADHLYARTTGEAQTAIG